MRYARDSVPLLIELSPIQREIAVPFEIGEVGALAARRKGDGEKLAIARRLLQQTTMTRALIAARAANGHKDTPGAFALLARKAKTKNSIIMLIE